MSEYPLSKYSAKIKDVYIELKNYQFFHSPYDSLITKNRFIGREKIKSRIISILQNTQVKSGSYLVTGFRGMGKTSVVRQALDEFNDKQNNTKRNNTDNKNFINSLDFLINEFMKITRIFFCCIFTYFIIHLINSGLLIERFTFINLSYVSFVVFFLVTKWQAIKELRNTSKSAIQKTSNISQTNPSEAESNSFEWIRKNIFTIFIAVNLIPVLLLLFNFYRIVFEINYLSAIFTLSLLLIFLVAAQFVTKFNEVFESIWTFFRIVFTVFLFILLTMVFFNYKYVCNKSALCRSEIQLMNDYFPPLSFSKKTAINDSNKDGKNSNDSQSVSNTNNIPRNESVESKPTAEADAVNVILRLIISFLFSYLILSAILFFIDFIYSVRISLMKIQNDDRLNEYRRFEINLSQDSLDEMEILRRMTIEIENYWQGQRFEFENDLFKRKLYSPWNLIIRKINRPRKNQFEPSFKRVSEKLNLLKNRMSGSLTTRRERKTPTNITTPIAGLVEFSMPLGSHTSNDEIAYQIASVKEAEDQLRDILDDIDILRNSENKLDIPQFVFIIDELDKIDPHNSSVIHDRESSNPLLDTSIYSDDTNRFRQRREAVGRLLANLKGFLNVAKAKFFFIGGREMFDADLADIADRESFYSSVFNDVIYVDSFYKDSIGKDGLNAGGITQMTETYLCNIILNDLGIAKNTKSETDTTVKNDRLNLKYLFKFLKPKKDNLWLQFDLDLGSKSDNSAPAVTQAEDKVRIDESNRQKYKIISTLQNYIIYLTYRSSGTPKKLNGLVEHLVVKGPKLDSDSKRDRFFEENVVVLHSDFDKNKPLDFDKNKPLSDRLFLKFGFNTQYELGLTANLYRPYLIANSRHLKSLGDKLLFSSSFIIDHILKFHPFGFSWRNLELIPEVVLVNREPNLREFIEELMRFFSINYIRDTVSGIFDYRFRSIIRRELVHLSKTSDLSAAAFNFTLDESLATKRYYKRKFKELNEKYKGYTPIEGDNQFVHSINFVQTILGDLHFYDKEYDEAILYYTESIQTLRLPNAITDRKITRHQFLLWVKNKLKLGLTLEKIRAFDSAFSLYKTLNLDTERYFKNIVSKSDYETSEGVQEAEDHRTIHLMTMPFIALLAVTEKARQDGITYTNLFTNRNDFLRTINAPKEDLIKSNQEFDFYRKYYLMADYYNNVGSILYYKNCQFSKFFEENSFWLDAFIYNQDKNNRIINQQSSIYNINMGEDKRPYDFFPSLSAFSYYWNSLYFLLKYHQERLTKKIKENLQKNNNSNSAIESNESDSHLQIPLEDNLLALCTGYLLPECIDMVSSNRLHYIANVVSKIGDSILASLNEAAFDIPKEEFNALDISAWEKDTEKNREANIEWFKNNLGQNLFTAETVLYTYKLAATLYKRAGYSSYYASHLTKILYVIKDLIELNKNKKDEIENFLGIDWGDKNPFKKLEEIAETIFRATTWNNEVSNRPQILKYREIFEISIKGNKDRELIYNIINNISDSKEVIVLVESIKIKLGKQIENKENKDIFIRDYFTLGKTITSAYGTMSNRYQRMLELKYRTERCFYIVNDVLKLGTLFNKKLEFLEVFDKEKIIDGNGNANDTIKGQIREIIKAGTQGNDNVTINDVVAFLIHEALFSLSQLIKMIKLYNPGYVIGFSFIAEAHSRMGAWCQAYDNYLKIIDEDIYDNYLSFLQNKKKSLKQNGKTEEPEYKKIAKHINSWRINNWKRNQSKIKSIEIESFNSEIIKQHLKKVGKEITETEINNEIIERNNAIIDVFFTANQISHTYYILENWSSRIVVLKKDKPYILKDKFVERIQELLGDEGFIYLESKNHYESAVQYYYKMIQMHSDGKTYKDKLHEVYMLEDDYNDNVAHYTIAAERLRINTGKIKEKINDLNDKIKDSKVYKYDSYLISNDDILDGVDIEIINKHLDYFATNINEDNPKTIISTSEKNNAGS